MSILKQVQFKNGRCRFYFLGIKIFSYRKKKQIRKNEWMCARVCRLHASVFPQFKNINQGKDVVIVATGPSLNRFNPIPNAVYIGVNKAFKYDGIKLDYLFMQDYTGMQDYIEDNLTYPNKKLVRFYGICPPAWENAVIPESIAIRHKALRYYVHAKQSIYDENPPNFFAYDLSSEILQGEKSVVFPALQFALWTNPKRIYLVGCDCSSMGYFFGQKSATDFAELYETYQKMKDFIKMYYPETEIISVNPVGLKGLFKDWEQ